MKRIIAREWLLIAGCAILGLLLYLIFSKMEQNFEERRKLSLQSIMTLKEYEGWTEGKVYSNLREVLSGVDPSEFLSVSNIDSLFSEVEGYNFSYNFEGIKKLKTFEPELPPLTPQGLTVKEARLYSLLNALRKLDRYKNKTVREIYGEINNLFAVNQLTIRAVDTWGISFIIYLLVQFIRSIVWATRTLRQGRTPQT